MSTIRIATRSSNLALWQAYHVRDHLQRVHPDLQVELVEMKTRGDKFLSAPLSQIGGKGWFVKELEAALLEDAADIAVHSMKDVPVGFPDGLGLAVICERGDPTDALVIRSDVGAHGLDDLPHGARLGTASLRRAAQALVLRPDLQVGPVRGNVETRLSKLDGGEFDAIVLASAGLVRLGLEARITQRLGADQFLPAGGQGAVGIECRTEDVATTALLAPLAHAETSACVVAERAVSRRLGGSCSVPLAAYAVQADGGLHLRALVASHDGRQCLTAEGHGADPDALGTAVADDLIAQGARPILEAAIAAAEAAGD